MRDPLTHIAEEARNPHPLAEETVRLNRILAPVDFSPASKAGLAFAASVAERFQSELHLVYVIEPPVLPEWGYVHLEIREAKLRRAAEERLAQFPGESGIDPRLVRSAKILDGEPENKICQAAEEGGADIIVLASHGLGGIKHMLTGSTCERVVRQAPCPVLAVQDDALKPGAKLDFAPRRILIATDFSDASKKAFPYASVLARKFEAGLTLLYAAPNHLPSEPGPGEAMLDEAWLQREAEAKLSKFRQTELDARLPVQTVVRSGSPAREICALAESEKAGLIVLSTHGRTGLKHFALGSVAEAVVRHAPCPVLVVRERERDFAGSQAERSRQPPAAQ